jgi:hypothetical protein
MLFAFLVLTLGAPVELAAQHDSPPVTEFKRLYASHGDFKRVVDLMFDNVHPLANGSENP